VSEKKEQEKDSGPVLPEISSDGYWTKEVWGQTFRFREAKLRERSLASNQARAVAPNSPNYEEQARLFSMIVQRRMQDGAWEELPFGEIMEKGETFLYELTSIYEDGILAKKIQVKKSSKTSKQAAEATSQKS